MYSRFFCRKSGASAQLRCATSSCVGSTKTMPATSSGPAVCVQLPREPQLAAGSFRRRLRSAWIALYAEPPGRSHPSETGALARRSI